MLGRVFKAYDIRGTYPDLLNDQMAWQIGFGSSKFLRGEAISAGDHTPMMRNVIVGRDMRKSSPALTKELIRGITEEGGDVVDIGLVDTPFVYFAINHLDCAGGVMTTASHNPPQYNGFKVSKRRAKPVGEQGGLAEIRKHAAMADRVTPKQATGRVQERDLWEAYKAHVRSFLDMAGEELKVVIDASNAMAGTSVPKIFGKKGADVPGLEIIELNFENASGNFAHDPNPLVTSNLRQLQEAVIAKEADLGICFDGDADRCMIVDEKGGIVGCDHLTALLARYFLADAPGSPVVFDLRSSKAVPEEILAAGGKPIRSRVGHVFMKEQMAQMNAVFGGELSGHFYFRRNFNADSGVIAMATVLSVLAKAKKPMSKLIKPIARYVQSGEINFQTEDKKQAIEEMTEAFASRGSIDELDGITIDCFEREGWWFNVRPSNTEDMLRLNAEAKDQETLEEIVASVSPLLGVKLDH